MADVRARVKLRVEAFGRLSIAAQGKVLEGIDQLDVAFQVGTGAGAEQVVIRVSNRAILLQNADLVTPDDAVRVSVVNEDELDRLEKDPAHIREAIEQGNVAIQGDYRKVQALMRLADRYVKQASLVERSVARQAGPPPKHRPRVRIFGAGVTGLTAAQELIERGFDVEVVEKEGIPLVPDRTQVGGVAATQYARLPAPQSVMQPTEKLRVLGSLHVDGAHQVFDTDPAATLEYERRWLVELASAWERSKRGRAKRKADAGGAEDDAPTPQPKVRIHADVRCVNGAIADSVAEFLRGALAPLPSAAKASALSASGEEQGPPSSGETPLFRHAPQSR